MRGLVLILLAGVLAAGSAEAQVPPSTPPPAESAPFGSAPGESLSERGVPRFDLVGRLLQGLRAADLAGRLFLIPPLSLSEEYDSNVFGTASNRESDFITRPVAGLALSYVTEQTRLLAGLTVETEFFAKNSDLNDVDFEGLGALDLQYPISPRLTTGFSASFTRAESVVDIRRETGVTAVEVGREEISVARASASVSYLLDPVTTGDGRYSITYTDVSGGPSDTEHELNLAMTRGFTPVDSGLLRYIFQYFDSDEVESEFSHTVRLGYARQFGPRTRFRIELGPQATQEGDVTASADISFAHEFRRASLLLAYTREQDVVVGLSGPQTVDTVSASLDFEPVRFLNAGLAAAASRISRDDDESSDTTVYSFLATAAYPLTRWLTGRGTYRFSYDDNSERIPRHVVTLTLEFSYPILLR